MSLRKENNLKDLKLIKPMTLLLANSYIIYIHKLIT